MRLDEFLKKKRYFSSRTRAKRAILKGKVIVDGEVITKPSFRVRGGEKIEVLIDDRPEGYFKLKAIDEEVSLLKGAKRALDIGFGAGGFSIYCLENGLEVIAIDLEETELASELSRRAEFTFIKGDAFLMDLEYIVDLLLIDVTTEQKGTLSLLNKYSKCLTSNGRILSVFKRPPIENEIKDEISRKYHTIKWITPEEKDEVYWIGKLR
ncbi:TlyA family rRNA (cytidine-2'-O)-methyltransferase [Thermococci archaeon]|nr:MAG: TlyA family rRNA (cytidine-2'-O)-methyltransferase [Thermococci archaeon]